MYLLSQSSKTIWRFGRNAVLPKDHMTIPKRPNCFLFLFADTAFDLTPPTQMPHGFQMPEILCDLWLSHLVLDSLGS